MNRPHIKVLLATLVALGASACGSGASAPTSSTEPTTDDGIEATTANPRLAVTYDGGVMVVDATSGEVLVDESLPGFVRVAPAGDDRHVLVAGEGGWRALDLGSWGHDHDDHAHHYTGTPQLTEIAFEAEEPGHVVAHEGITTLFDDGTGSMTVFDPHDLEEGQPEATTVTADAPHHGVGVQLPDRNLIHTVGTEDARSGVRLVSPAGHVLAETDECPGVHGEAFAQDLAVFGCEDGVVVVDGREIRKIDSPDAYGRIGNQAGSDVSPVLLGDYKTDADAELERPTRISLIDTRTNTLRLVDVGASYTFRSLGRGPAGEALVLGTDGSLHVIDAGSGEAIRSIDVIDRWREPLDWQQPRPTLHVADATAYVTDPRSSTVHVLDLTTWRISSSIDLPHVPNEIVANVG